jgi:hypothetical protein
MYTLLSVRLNQSLAGTSTVEAVALDRIVDPFIRGIVYTLDAATKVAVASRPIVELMSLMMMGPQLHGRVLLTRTRMIFMEDAFFAL